MKKLLIFLLALLCLSSAVSAAFSLSAAPSSIFFGNAVRNSTITATFTITNNGDSLTGIVPASSAAAKYNIVFDQTGFDLNINQSKTLSFNVAIPIDEPTTNHSIGYIIMNSNEFNFTNLINMNVDAKGGMEIDEFDARVYYRDGGTDSNQGISNGQKLDFEDQVRPGSKLEFRIDVNNAFTSDEDIDIEDITATITIKEIGDEDDLDEESDRFDLKPNEEEKVTILIGIPLEVEEGTYDVLVEIEGEDTEGTKHRIEWNLKLSLVKERRELIIRKANLTGSVLSCDRNTKLNIEVLNTGARGESDAKVEAVNKGIGLNFVEEGIRLETNPFEDDDQYEKSLAIKVGDNVAAGTYPITVNAYTGEALLESKAVSLVIEDCKSAEEITEQEPTEEGAIEEEEKEEVTTAAEEIKVKAPEEEGTKIPVIAGKVTETKELPSMKPIILALIIAGVLAVPLGVFVALKFMPKK